jgi:23S rRNA (cytosine1962-C5)-methyltransferase
MNRIILKPGEEDRLLSGHPWVYDNEIAREIPDPSMCAGGGLPAGGIADVESSRKRSLGRAFVNPNSKIRARIFSHSKEGVDRGFFKRRIRQAMERRLQDYDLQRESARLVFGEADFLPGLIVDRFVGHETGGDNSGPAKSWLSLQLLTYAMDLRKGDIVDALKETLSWWPPEMGPAPGLPAGMAERDEAHVRELEGLPLRSGILEGSVPEGGIIIKENGLPFFVDLMGGQKTGHLLDQKENRAFAARFAPGRRVLDACCHSGGFAIHAAAAGAREVTALDVSAQALSAVRRNAELNGLSDRIRTLEGNVFDVLRDMERSGERFGLIILDPPAFAKSRTAIEGAARGYKEINLRAMNLLEKDGILVTCSCSQAMTEDLFRSMIAGAAMDAGKRLHQLAFRHQAPDHPVLLGFPESLYLKCGVYRAL